MKRKDQVGDDVATRSYNSNASLAKLAMHGVVVHSGEAETRDRREEDE